MIRAIQPKRLFLWSVRSIVGFGLSLPGVVERTSARPGQSRRGTLSTARIGLPKLIELVDDGVSV